MLQKDNLPIKNGAINKPSQGLDKSKEEAPDYLISISLCRQIIREILTEFFGEIQKVNQDQRQWYDTDPAYSLLGLNDPEQLREAVRCGLLRIGHEVRDRRKPKAKLPRYQFHIEKCQKRLLERPERRKKV